MKLSIIIPVYNNLDELKTCVASVMNQSFSDFELVIIDGGSTDGTLEYLKTLPIKVKWISEPDTGVYNAMNKGVKTSTGDWLYFIGADDRLYNSNVISNVFSLLKEEIQVVSGVVYYDDNIISPKKPSWNWRIWLRNNLHHQGTFYSRKLFKKTLFCEEYQVLSDYEFNLKLYQNNSKHQFLNNVVAICGAKGISKSYNWDMFAEELKIKVNLTNILLYPIFFIFIVIKMIYKKIS